MPTSYPEDDLADGRAALLSGWSTGSEPGLVITRASGALVWDAKGNEYIDCTSMAWSNNIGASHPEVVEAAFAQARQLSHLRSNFDSIPLLLLAKAMTDAAPGRPQADRVHPARQPGRGDGHEAGHGEPAASHRPVAGPDRRLPRTVTGQHGARLAAPQPRVRPHVPAGAADPAALRLPVRAQRGRRGELLHRRAPRRDRPPGHRAASRVLHRARPGQRHTAGLP